MTAYREPGRDIDVTEIERAKIHEEAETKRKLISEREETRRARFKEYGPTVPIAVTIVALTALATGTCVANNHIEARASDKPVACVETAEVVSVSSPMKKCIGGGMVETEKLTDAQILVRCRCTAPAVKP